MTTSALPAPAAPEPQMRRGVREGVLTSLRAARDAAAGWEVESARLVTEWADGHRLPARLVDQSGALLDQVIELDEPVQRPSLPGLQSPMRLAGPGAPLVSDLAFCTLANSLSMSLDGARGYVGEVVELGFRLPCLWDRVRHGEVRLWRAREVARATTCLPAEGAAWVDAQLAAVIGSCSGAQLRRVVDAALDRFDPEAAAQRRRVAADDRHFDIHCGDPEAGSHASTAGVVAVDGVLDLPDALDLEAAVAARAEQLAACGSEESRDVRRALALGEIARDELALPITGAAVHEEAGGAGRPVRLVLHLSSDAIGARALAGAIGRCENTRSPVSAEQIRSWCGAPGARVSVQPVIDLSGHHPTESYEIPARLRRQVTVRDPQCVFPWCTRRADRADLDHIVPWEEGGPTCGCNLAPLCRRHHRAKTHAGWSYVMVTPGTYLWHSPGGTTSLVDARGTFRVPDVGQVCRHAAATRRAEPPPWPERAPGSARAGSGPAHQAGSPHPVDADDPARGGPPQTVPCADTDPPPF